MDKANTQVQNTLTDHAQIMHGSLGNNRNTWHENNSSQGLSENTKSLKSATSSDLVCMLVLVTTWITKIHGKILWIGNMAYYKTHVGLNLIGGTHQSWQKWQKCMFQIRSSH